MEKWEAFVQLKGEPRSLISPTKAILRVSEACEFLDGAQVFHHLQKDDAHLAAYGNALLLPDFSSLPCSA